MQRSQNENNPNIKNQQGAENSMVEVDSAHLRFRERFPTKRIYCYSCHQTFDASTQYEINMHYESVHDKSHSHCLYCGGKTHLYKADTGALSQHHSCATSKRIGEA